ncbi:MAG: NUDIX domain-containing protein [Chloroflexales bacterium]|nr:NUDIX domain-containing protein [Chloroflexales bacterium]
MRHTSDTIRIDHVVIAILRHADQIVMVQQLTPHDHQPYWVLPGGLVEAGELLTEAIIREVQEEVGVHVTAIGAIVGVSQIDRPAQTAQTLSFLVEVAHWQSALQCQDPDGEVHSVELVAQEEAISRLQRNGAWPGMRELLLAYLRKEVQAGTMWFYRERADGQQLLGTLPPARNA